MQGKIGFFCKPDRRICLSKTSGIFAVVFSSTADGGTIPTAPSSHFDVKKKKSSLFESMTDGSTESEPEASDASTAIVLGGGGARAGYQTGVLEYVGETFPRASVPLMTGVSAGSINAAHLAADPGPWAHRTGRLTSYWEELTMDDVFAPRSLWTLGRSLVRGTPRPKQTLLEIGRASCRERV